MNDAPPSRLATRAGWAGMLLGLLGGYLALSAARRDLGPEARALLAAQLRLPPERVQVGRAALYPFGELRLFDVRVEHPRGTLRATEARVEVDALRALRGQIVPRRLLAEGLTLSGFLGPLQLRAERGSLQVLPEGRGRLLLHELSSEGTPRRFAPQAAHLSVDLRRGGPERLAVSGLRLGAAPPLDLLLRFADGALQLRGATAGAQLAGGVGPDGAEVQIDMDRLRLPLQLGPFVDLSDTRLSGQLGLRAGTRSEAAPPPWPLPLATPLPLPSSLSLRGHLALSDLGLRHPVLTSGSLPNLTLLLDGDLEARAEGGGLRASAERLSLSMGELRLSLSGHLRLEPGGGHGADLDLVLDEIDCAQLLQSLPRRLVPHLEGLGARGQIGGQLQLAYDSATLPEVDVRPAVNIGCQVVSDPPRADAHALLDPRLSIERPGEDGQPRRLPLGPQAPRSAGVAPFQPLRGLPWPVQRAFLVAEDNAFYLHRGFDVQMMIRALGLDLKEGGALKGASTVTQQVAKNLWLGTERALGRKLEEAVLAWRLEQVVPKERILEVYLNLVELGSGIYGLPMAAQHYFGETPARLTLDQAAQLAALLPAPRRGMDAAWAKRHRDILHRYGTALIPQAPARE